jgi:hypothetical protein
MVTVSPYQSSNSDSNLVGDEWVFPFFSRLTMCDPTLRVWPGDGRIRDPSKVISWVSESQNESSIDAMSSARLSSMFDSALS